MSDKPKVDKVGEEIDDIAKKYDLEHKPIREAVSTGVLGVDFVTELPGIPRGTIIDLFGAESLGKTTFALTMIADRVEHGEHCVYMDIEHRLQRKLVDIVIPINNDLMKFTEPRHGQAAMEELLRLSSNRGVKMIVVDSVAALFDEGALDPDNESKAQAKVARMMSDSLKVLGTVAYDTDTIIVFINQMRDRPMVIAGPTRAPTGGNALKYYSSLRFELQRDSPIKRGERIIGQRVRLIAVKNSFGAPGVRAPMSIIFGEGVDKIRDLVDQGIELGVIDKSSSWFRYKDIKANGEDSMAEQALSVLGDLTRDVLTAWHKRKAEQEAEREKRKQAYIAARQTMLAAQAEALANVNN